MIVLDSSFLIAFHNERDAHHTKAVEGMADFLGGRWGKGLLLEYVFVEIVTVLMVRRDLSVASRVGKVLLDAAELEFVACSDVFVETMNAFTAQKGTRLSFADMAIATVARTRGVHQILTFDEEFKKLGAMKVYPA